MCGTNLLRRCSIGLPLVVLAMAAETTPLEKADRIVVYKSRRELVLLKGDHVLKTYKVALGKNPLGSKQRQGDGKTPEGVYKISGRNPASAFHRSLRISYPSAADRERATKQHVDPGGDIMIHGLPNGQGYLGAAHRLVDWTDGCIALTDREIEEVWRVVPDGTPIDIRP